MTSPEPGEMEDVVVEAAKAVGAVLYGADERSYKATSGRWDLCLLCAQAACAGLLAHLSRQEEEIKGLRAEVKALARVCELEAILRDAGNVFHQYAELHRAKGTPDGDQKAEVNDQHAARIRAALTP